MQADDALSALGGKVDAVNAENIRLAGENTQLAAANAEQKAMLSSQTDRITALTRRLDLLAGALGAAGGGGPDSGAVAPPPPPLPACEPGADEAPAVSTGNGVGLELQACGGRITLMDLQCSVDPCQLQQDLASLQDKLQLLSGM